MAAGRAVAMVASSAAVLLLLLAGGAYADDGDCYKDCYDHCMSRVKQDNYCGHACDKICHPDADATLHQHPIAVVEPLALLAGHHTLDKKQDADAVRPPAALPDHPFHETHHDVVEPVGEPDRGHVVRPARVPVLP